MPLNHINEIAELASSLTPPGDIAALLSIDEDTLRDELSNRHSPVRIAYLKARAETALILRKQEIELAKVGSPLAVSQVNHYIRDMMSDDDL